MQSSPFQTQNEKTKEYSLELLMRTIVGEPTDAQIETRVNQFKSARELAEAIDITNAINSATIDPRIIYCNLTGQPIGQRSERNLKMALHVRGKTDISDLIEYGAQTSIADWWLGINADSLNALAELDPCGYYVYAASIAFEHKHKQFFNKKVHPKDAINGVQILKQKIALFYKLQQLPITEIIKANEAWRDFLALVDPAKLNMKEFATNNIIFASTLEKMGDPEMVFNIGKNLKQVVMNLLARAHPQMSRYTYADVQKLKEENNGISTFSQQVRIREFSYKENILAMMERLIGHGPINKSAVLPDVKPKKYMGDMNSTTITNESKLELKVASKEKEAKPTSNLSALLAASKGKNGKLL